jgi:MoaA/NifB/PqqE/SkfB family radical SAM enzyme
MIKGLHIELTNKCTLKCPRCSRTEFIDRFPKKWKNIDINIEELLRFIDVDLSDTMINLCGNYGDPIYHDGLIDAVKGLKDKGANVNIATNGSYRSPEWWSSLADILGEDDHVTFAIDGMPDTFTKYRINADWPSIAQGIDIIGKSKTRMRWQYILFSYNIKDVPRASKLSNALGFDEFFTMDSGRWDNGTEWLTPEIDEISKAKQEWKEGNLVDIDPKCSDQAQHYISADGFYIPCCWMGEHRFYYKSNFYKDREMYDIRKNTLGEIIGREHVINFYDNIMDSRLEVCQFSCPKVR